MGSQEINKTKPKTPSCFYIGTMTDDDKEDQHFIECFPGFMLKNNLSSDMTQEWKCNFQ